MKIWEAIIYGIFGGITELLPISFAGHIALLQNAFHMSHFSEGGGYYVRAAICVGVILAIYLTLRSDVLAMGTELGQMFGAKTQSKQKKDRHLLRRSVMLCAVAFLLMLISLIYLSAAERITRLLYIIVFFLINAGLLYLCCRSRVGNKTEKDATIVDMILIGLVRMLSVFPGMSPLASSMGIGRARGISLQYNIRIAYILTLAYQIVLFVFYLIRAFIYCNFSLSVILPCIFALLFAMVFGYLAIQYFRYLLQRVKLYVFVYYSLEAAAIAAILAMINA